MTPTFLIFSIQIVDTPGTDHDDPLNIYILDEALSEARTVMLMVPHRGLSHHNHMRSVLQRGDLIDRIVGGSTQLVVVHYPEKEERGFLQQVVNGTKKVEDWEKVRQDHEINDQKTLVAWFTEYFEQQKVYKEKAQRQRDLEAIPAVRTPLTPFSTDLLLGPLLHLDCTSAPLRLLEVQPTL